LRRLILTLVIVVGLGAAMVVGREILQRNRTPLPRPEIVRVTRRDVGYVVKATGVIKPMIGAEVRVGSRISGVVARLFVRVGDTVAKGQPLADLDARDLEARQHEAAAALEVARATVQYTDADLRRKRELIAAHLIPPSDLDLAVQAFAVAEQRRAQAEASLDFAATQVGYARIDAPIAGVVASVSTQEGETVAASFAAPTFVTLLDLSRLEVWAYVDETDIGRVRSGQPARFSVDTYPDHEFDGRVVSIYPRPEIRDNVVDYITVLRFQSAQNRVLRPEMTTVVRISLDAHHHVLALPIRAIRRDGDRQFILRTVGESVERRLVTTASRDDEYWEVVDGIHEGDEVIVGDMKTN
jgi:macrolide-specific efflux system membrane fusion protein